MVNSPLLRYLASGSIYIERTVGEYTVYNMKTGEILENYALATVDGEQAGWAIPMNIDSITYGKDYMIFTDGTKATQTHDHLTNFKDGKAVVRVDSKTIRAIDTAGKTVWEYEFCARSQENVSFG